MSTPSTRLKAIRAAASIGALILLATGASPFPDASFAADDENDWTRMQAALRILATGDAAAMRGWPTRPPRGSASWPMTPTWTRRTRRG